MRNRLIAVSLFIVLAMSSGTAFASTKELAAGSETIPFTADAATTIAKNFSEDFYPDDQLSIRSVTPYCNEYGEESGYIVGFTKEDISYGYVVLDSEAESIIAEYSIGKNAQTPYQEALNSGDGVLRSNAALPLCLIKVNPFEYGIINPRDNSVSTNEGRQLTLDSVVSDEAAARDAKKPSDWEDATIPMSALYRNYNIKDSGNLEEFISINEDSIISHTGRYACAVTAYYAISGYYGVLNVWADYPEYVNLWNSTGTNTIYTNNGKIYGETSIEGGANGFVSYLASKGKSISQTTTSGKPDYSMFRTSIDNGEPCVFHGWLWNSDGTSTGHTMFVEGYLVAASKSDLSGLKILQVFDGWGDNVRYINYDYANYAQVRGSFFHG